MSKLERSGRSLLAMGTVAATVAMAASCDPCGGVVSCVTAPRVAIQGTLVDNVYGRGVSGARISLIRTDGLTRDSAATITDTQGNYQLELGTGSGTFDVDVVPVGVAPYRVRGLSLTSTTRVGGGQVFGPWVTTPVFATALELIYESNGAPIVGGVVSFRRTGGVEISGPGVVDGVFTSNSDVAGRVALLSGVYAPGAGDVIGELTVTVPGTSFGTAVIPDVHVKASYQFRPRDVLRIAVPPGLAATSTIYNLRGQ